MPPSPRLAFAAATLALLLGAHAARAQAPEPPDAEARYRTIESALARGEGPARLWWNGWAIGYAAMTAGQGTVALVAKDDGLKKDAAVGGAESLLGLAAVLVGPRGAFTGRATLAQMDASTPEARALRLKKAEGILEDAADGERFGHGVLTHLGAAAVNLTGTFVLWIGYQRYASGWLNLVGGTIISEAQILTQPTAAIGAWRDYQAGQLTAGAPPPPTFTWSVAPTPGGLTLAGTF